MPRGTLLGMSGEDEKRTTAEAVSSRSDEDYDDEGERLTWKQRVAFVLGDALDWIDLKRLLVVTGGLCFAVLVLVLWRNRHTLKYGDVPTWVATTAAIVAAIFAGLVYRREERRDARREAERRQAQATKVAAWVDLPSGEGVVHVHIRNASDVPVYDVRVSIHRTPEVKPYEPVEYQPAYRWELSVVPPGTEPRLIPLPTDELFGGSPKRFVTSMTFHDAAGIYWFRNAYGELFEDSDPHPWLYETEAYKPLN